MAQNRQEKYQDPPKESDEKKSEQKEEVHESYQPREHPSEESFRSDSRHSERQPRVDSSSSSSSSSRNPSNSYLLQPAVEDFALKENKQSQAPNKDVLYQGVRAPFEAITPEEEYRLFYAAPFEEFTPEFAKANLPVPVQATVSVPVPEEITPELAEASVPVPVQATVSVPVTPVPREVTMQAPSSHLSSLGTTRGSRGLGREQ